MMLPIKNSPLFYVPSESYNFFSVGDVSQDSETNSGSNVIFELKILLDSQYQITNRSVYSLGDIVGWYFNKQKFNYLVK